jgi:hypothetical protein
MMPIVKRTAKSIAISIILASAKPKKDLKLDIAAAQVTRLMLQCTVRDLPLTVPDVNNC